MGRRHESGVCAMSSSLLRAGARGCRRAARPALLAVVAAVPPFPRRVRPASCCWRSRRSPPSRQVMPRCTLTPVDDTSAGCMNSVLHNINYARLARSPRLMGPWARLRH